jgi:hypothetical protein
MGLGLSAAVKRWHPVAAVSGTRCRGAAACPSGDAQLGGDGGSGLSGAEQGAGVGDLFGGQGATTAADAASGAGGVEAFAGAFDDLLTLRPGRLQTLVARL